MKIKKNPKLNEEKNKVVYFQLGLFITSASMLMAFSWKSPKIQSFNFNEERIAAIPIDSVYIEKIEYPEIEPIVQKVQPVNTVLTEKIDEVEIKDEEIEKFELAPIDIAIDIEGGEDGEGFIAPGGENILEDFPDELAAFNGSFTQFLKTELVYPQISIDFGEEGIVYVSFVVEKDGDLSNFEILKGSTRSNDLRKEALRVVKLSPNWKPAIKNGEYVRSKVKVPVKFKLEK